MRTAIARLALWFPALFACSATSGATGQPLPEVPAPASPAMTPPAAPTPGFLFPVACAEEDRRAGPCADEYFPEGYDRSEPDEVGEIIADWHLRFLRGMGEPALSSCPPGVETYRFLWLRSFHDPYVVRVERRGEGVMRIVAKRGSGAGGYETGDVTVIAERELTAGEWEALSRAIDAHFWPEPPAPSQEGLPAPGRITLEELHIDGAEWVLEGCRGGVHRVVRLWSPESGELRDISLELLRLGGAVTDPIYK